jgi:hypothetical protein
MAQVTITDEQTRWIVQLAAWDEGCSEMGDFDLGCRADTLDSPENYLRRRTEAAARLARLTELAALADQVERAALGDRIEIPVGVVRFLTSERAGLHDCLTSPGPAFTAEHEERARWMYPAAEALEAEMTGTVA